MLFTGFVRSLTSSTSVRAFGKPNLADRLGAAEGRLMTAQQSQTTPRSP